MPWECKRRINQKGQGENSESQGSDTVFKKDFNYFHSRKIAQRDEGWSTKNDINPGSYYKRVDETDFSSRQGSQPN